MRLKESFYWSLVPILLLYALPVVYFLLKSFINWTWEPDSLIDYLIMPWLFRVIILLTVCIFLFKYYTWYDFTYYHIEDDEDYPI